MSRMSGGTSDSLQRNSGLPQQRDNAEVPGHALRDLRRTSRPHKGSGHGTLSGNFPLAQSLVLQATQPVTNEPSLKNRPVPRLNSHMLCNKAVFNRHFIQYCIMIGQEVQF